MTTAHVSIDPSWVSRFEQLVREHENALITFALRLSGSRSDASDLVQDTLERALRSFDSFTPGTNGRAWLFTILRHTFIDRCRRRRRDDGDCIDNLPGPRARGRGSLCAGRRLARTARARDRQPRRRLRPRLPHARLRRALVPGDRRAPRYPHEHGGHAPGARAPEAAHDARSIGARLRVGALDEHVEPSAQVIARDDDVVHLVRSVGDARRACVAVPLRKRHVVAVSERAVHLDRVVERLHE